MINLTQKRIVVTGGQGLLGSHIVDRLHYVGCEKVFSLRSKDYDLRMRDDVIRMYEGKRPNIVIHCAAAVGGIGWNRENSARSMYDNLTMSLHLMQEGIRYIEKFVQISSICAYPAVMSFPTKEETLWDGHPEPTHGAYGVAKRTLITMCQAYRQQYGLNAVCLLPANLYGPRDKTTHVVPEMIRKFIDASERKDSSVTLWGSGMATRDLLYVKDCAEAVVLATELYDSAEPVNLGSGKEITINELALRVAKETNYRGCILWDRSKPDGPARRLLDVSRAKASFGFEAKTDIRDGLKETIEWCWTQNA